ncbi:hypothetical protein KEM52_003242 [Ascosphaera acerosa]|nr:hypothetical protein KEM52_003242 [Ascosphaera acerosa]
MAATPAPAPAPAPAYDDDDKLRLALPFIQRRLAVHRRQQQQHQQQEKKKKEEEEEEDKRPPPPFFLGINGIQGAGKTTFVHALLAALARPPLCLRAAALSLDDLYLTHADQKARARTVYASNPLLQHRGQPGTHDVPLARQVLAQLKANAAPVPIPAYDKAAFNGEGDRKPTSREVVRPPLDVVLVEGWCLGYRRRPDREVVRAWNDAVRKRKACPAGTTVKEEQKKEGQDVQTAYSGRLGYVELDHVLAINAALADYDVFTDALDALIHLDAADTRFVYPWRRQQEAELRARSGAGMTEQQVDAFVDGYYPSYELYLDDLRKGVFRRRARDGDGNAGGNGNADGKEEDGGRDKEKEEKKEEEEDGPRQLRLVLDKSRAVRSHYLI